MNVSLGEEAGLKMCISHKFSGDAEATHLWTTFLRDPGIHYSIRFLTGLPASIFLLFFYSSLVSFLKAESEIF